jgi:hypothetical protein
MLSGTLKAEARFRVKTENHFEATISEQFQSNPSETVATRCRENKKIISLPDTFKVEALPPVRFLLVLTHNFEVGRTMNIRLSVFTICGLWFQREQWQNCKSKQAEGVGDKTRKSPRINTGAVIVKFKSLFTFCLEQG